MRGLTLLLLSAVAAAVLAGCGSSGKQSSPAALKLQREDLVAVARALSSMRGPVTQEVAATKAAWPLIANGLPADTSAISGAPRAAAAAQAAAQLKVPVLFSEAQAATLTGPASQLAGLFRSYALLSSRGWKLLDAAIDQVESGSPASALRPGKRGAVHREHLRRPLHARADRQEAARRLPQARRPAAFGAALSQAEVDALARTYSEASDRLHPHVGGPDRPRLELRAAAAPAR